MKRSIAIISLCLFACAATLTLREVVYAACGCDDVDLSQSDDCAVAAQSNGLYDWTYRCDVTTNGNCGTSATITLYALTNVAGSSGVRGTSVTPSSRTVADDALYSFAIAGELFHTSGDHQVDEYTSDFSLPCTGAHTCDIHNQSQGCP